MSFAQRHISYALALSTVLFAVPLFVHAESIRSFDADIVLATDGAFTVTETIVYDFEDESRHGIFRIIPTDHPEDASTWYKDRYIDIDVAPVAMDGRSVPYDVTTSGGSTRIKIGDPDLLISGVHTYTISYTVRSALFYKEDTAELYWNVTGTNWDVPILSTQVSLFAPKGALRGEHTCYVGTEGSTERCAVTTTDSAVQFSARALSPGEGVTIAQALDTAVIGTLILERIIWAWILLPLALLLLLGMIVGLYRVQTKHKMAGPVIAQYEPYQGVRPMYAGMLIDKRLDASDITAGIVYLAEQGFLKITRLEKKFLIFTSHDYELNLLKKPREAPGAFLSSVLELIFDSSAGVGERVTLSELKNNLPKQRLNQKILSKLRKALRRDMREQGFLERVAPLLWTRRTTKGYEAMQYLKGFKEFLSVTGKDRFEFHNAPEKSPEQFLEYLPYAIAFGVEKKWAKVFDDVTIPNPAWYDGGTTGAFSAAAFASDMSTFSSSLSTSSGSSAASGGGAVGGGAGGGGGGSW